MPYLHSETGTALSTSHETRPAEVVTKTYTVMPEEGGVLLKPTASCSVEIKDGSTHVEVKATAQAKPEQGDVDMTDGGISSHACLKLYEAPNFG